MYDFRTILSFFACLIIFSTIFEYCTLKKKPIDVHKVETLPTFRFTQVNEGTTNPTFEVTPGEVAPMEGVLNGDVSGMHSVTIGDGTLPPSDEHHVPNGQVSTDSTKTTISDSHVKERTNVSSFDMQENETKPSPCKEALFAFSLYRTLPYVLNTTVPPGAYGCMHGVRFLTMAWIILGHVWQLGLYVIPGSHLLVVAENWWSQYEYHSRPEHAVINEMSTSVESFFVLGGALVTISFMKNMQKQRNKVTLHQMILYYVHRYWRLTPVYAIVMLLFVGLYPLFGRGPLFPESMPDAENCKSNWWTNLLYVNNLVNTKETCMGWTWYLANDFQFYILAPIFIIPMYLKPVVGFIILGLVYAAHLASSFFTWTMVTEDPPKKDWYHDAYITPWCRFGPYAIGIALGYILFKTKCKVRIHWGLVSLGYVLSLAFIGTAIYGGFWVSNRPIYILWEVGKRNLFAFAVSWIIFACCTGYGGFINIILSWRGFVGLSKLTYVGYLIHIIILYTFYYMNMRMIYVDILNMAMYFGGLLIYTVGFAFVTTLMFEVPILAIEKIIIPRGKETS